MRVSTSKDDTLEECAHQNDVEVILTAVDTAFHLHLCHTDLGHSLDHTADQQVFLLSVAMVVNHELVAVVALVLCSPSGPPLLVFSSLHLSHARVLFALRAPSCRLS